jgi:pyruvate dehydrogenase E2 component (dihydrolipoamide acetyltransferase)
MANTVEMPKLGFDMAEGTLVRWVKAEGDPVQKGDVLAEIETDKATVEVESVFGGVVLRHLVPEKEIVPVGTPIAVIGAPGETIDQPAAPAAAPVKAEAAAAPAAASALPPAQPESGPAGAGKASPLARRMAREHGLDLTAIRGSGPGGRVIKRDIEAYLKAPPAAMTAAPAAAAAAAAATAPAAKPAPAAPLAPAPVFSALGPAPEDKVIPLTRMRATIARRLVESVTQVPHIYVTHDYDMAAVVALRQQLNVLLEGSGEKLSVNDFVVKAVALALRQYPRLNASLQGSEIVEHGQVNVGVAVALQDGLLTVVCKDTDRKSLRQISAELRQMAGRARDGKVKPEDIEGSTFSVSNLGMFDVEQFTAIINPPEAAILAVGSVRETFVVVDGQVKPAQRMKATISVDHRIIDGADAARFLQALAPYLEEPMRLML